MAPVTRSRDRGQLILVAGLTVAMILVMLVLLLNTVIYTENLATRGIDSGAGDAIEYRATVVGSVEELIAQENEHYDEGHPPVVGVSVGLETINEHLRERDLYRGTIAEIGYDEEEDINPGNPIAWQANSGELSSGTIMTGVMEIERFVLIIDSVASVEENGGEGPFSLVMDDWSMTIEVSEGDPDEWKVTVEEASGDSTPEYYSTEQLEIDIVNHTIEADDRSKPDPIDPLPPKTTEKIEFTNGGMVTGTFELQTDGKPNDDTLTRYEDEEEHYGNAEHEPYYTRPVGSVDLTIHYETSELQFKTTETIRAEEP